MPASTPDGADDGTVALGDRFGTALLDLLDVLAERGDRLRLDDDTAVDVTAAAIQRWTLARWAQTPPQARPALVVEAVRVALATRTTPGYGSAEES